MAPSLCDQTCSNSAHDKGEKVGNGPGGGQSHCPHSNRVEIDSLKVNFMIRSLLTQKQAEKYLHFLWFKNNC